MTDTILEFFRPYALSSDVSNRLLKICLRSEYPCKKHISKEFNNAVQKMIGKGSPAAARKARKFMQEVPNLAEALNEINRKV